LVCPLAGADFNQMVGAELLVGAPGDNGSSNDQGAVWVVFLNTFGGFGGAQKIGDSSVNLHHGDVLVFRLPTWAI